MRAILLCALALLSLTAPPAAAQALPGNEDLDVSKTPYCFTVVNEAPYSIYGDFSTNYYTRPDGIRARHRSNFRLMAAGEVDEEGRPADRAEFCSYGPFYPGRKLEMTLRTLVPVFACQTRLDAGPIIIQGIRKPQGGTQTWAVCHE